MLTRSRPPPPIPQYELHTLESHVKMLSEGNHKIPDQIVKRLEDLRAKERRRTAKRAANRRSACTSRARKKAMVEQMTRTNAR